MAMLALNRRSWRHRLKLYGGNHENEESLAGSSEEVSGEINLASKKMAIEIRLSASASSEAEMAALARLVIGGLRLKLYC